MAHMSVPCHEGPPATKGHFSSEPAVAGGGRYYCTTTTTTTTLGYNRFLRPPVDGFSLSPGNRSKCPFLNEEIALLM